jgi:YHS domain-containing protein
MTQNVQTEVMMKAITTVFISTMFLLAAVFSNPVFGKDYTHSAPGLSGYDPVAYFKVGKPMKGSGYHVTDVDGVTYAFASKEHKKMFTKG